MALVAQGHDAAGQVLDPGRAFRPVLADVGLDAELLAADAAHERELGLGVRVEAVDADE